MWNSDRTQCNCKVFLVHRAREGEGEWSCPGDRVRRQVKADLGCKVMEVAIWDAPKIGLKINETHSWNMDTRFLRDDFGMWETHHKPPSVGGLTPPIPGEIQTWASHCSKQTLEKWSCGPPQFLTWKTQDARLGPRTPSKYGRFQPLDVGLSENMCCPKNTCLIRVWIKSV